MKKILIFLMVLLAAMVSASCSSAWEINHPMNYNDNTTLQIVRTELSSSECEWAFYFHYGSTRAITTPIDMFSIGVLVDDTNGMPVGDLQSGHFYGYDSSIAGLNPVEEVGNITWAGFSLPNNSDAWFKFKTDLMGVDYADHIARDHSYIPLWMEQKTPGAVPEPATLLTIGIGLLPLIVRRKKSA